MTYRSCLLIAALLPGTVAAEMSIHYLDVGQGDATAVTGPGGCTILIDAGRHDRDDILPHLESLGIDSLDLLIGTHPHADHIGQFDRVLTALPVDEVWLSGYEHTTQTFERALDAILDSDAEFHEPRAGEEHSCGMLEVTVLHPEEPLSDIHDNIAVRISYEEFAAVFTGDAETTHEQEMIERGEGLDADVLQLGHHGSRTSTSDAFLEAVSPSTAIYSAAEDNQYGHPRGEVVDRIHRNDIELIGTDAHGTITVASDGRGFTLTTETDAAIEEHELEPEDGEQCVDINSASIDALTGIVHIGEARAKEIVDVRDAAPFEQLQELTRIDGLGPARVDDIKEEGEACVQ